MLPHPETVRKITALHYQERLRDVAQHRRAANPEERARSRPTTSWSTRLAAVYWLIELVMRGRRAKRVHAKRVHMMSPVGRDSSRSVHRMT